MAAICELACDCTEGPECAFIAEMDHVFIYRDFDECIAIGDCSEARSPFLDCLQAYKLEGCVEVDGVSGQGVPDRDACGGEE